MTKFMIVSACVAAFLFFLGVGPLTALIWAVPITLGLKVGSKVLL